MPEGLKIQVGADVQDAVKSLKQLEKQTDATFSKVAVSVPNAVNKTSAALKSYSTSSSQATQATINLGRVVQDAPFGFIGIANNINPLLESFQRLKASTGTTGGAIKELGKSLMGAGGLGLAVSLASTAMLVFGDSIFGAAANINKAEVATNLFKDSLRQLGQQADDIKDRLDFTAQVQKLRFTLANGKGAASDIFGFNVDSKAAQTFVTELDKRIVQLGNTVVKFQPQLQDFQSKIADVPDKLLTKGQVLLKLYGDINKIPQDALDGLNSNEKRFINEFQGATKEIESLQKKRSEALQSITINDLRAQQAQRDEQKRLLELSKQDYEKYVNEVISKAKKLSDAFKNSIDLKLQSSVFDTQSDTFKKSLEFIKNFESGKFKFVFDASFKVNIKDVEFPPPDVIVKDTRSDAERLSDLLGKEYTDYFKAHPVDASVDVAIKEVKDAKTRGDAIAGLFNFAQPLPDVFSKMEKNSIRAAQTIQGILTPAFEGLFDAILKGENPLKSFFQGLGQAVAQLIQKLISAAITAAILSSVFPGGVGGAKGFGSIFGKILGFASGGVVSGPTLALIGEGAGTSRSNPEVVAPLDQLRSMLSDLGGGGSQVVYVTGRLRGNDMLLQNARTSRSQRRTTGRG